MKRHKKVIISLGIIILVGILFTPYFISTRTPVKYAVRIEDIGQYPNCIVVKEAFHTGTGWEQVGDQNGMFEAEQRRDVYLTGKELPLDALGDYYNIFVCEVKHTGQFTQLSPEIFEQYEVLEWYPLYPVKRDTILPQWFYSKDYLAKSDKIQ